MNTTRRRFVVGLAAMAAVLLVPFKWAWAKVAPTRMVRIAGLEFPDTEEGWA